MDQDETPLSLEELQEAAEFLFDDLLEAGGSCEAVAAFLSVLGQWAAETGTVEHLAQHMQSTIEVALEVRPATVH